ncbi:MAG: S-adenosylmethionine decarboxylase [Phascolarctobacterium sp.]|nr:S-adenosylmethionine decarboxylase [Phascolarctobacterium sp.]
MEYPDLRGKLIALDMYNCDANILEDYQRVIQIIETRCKEFGMQLLKIEHSDAEEGNAYTLFGICVQGHIVLHAFPEYGFCGMDTYSIGQESHPSHCAKAIRSDLNPDKIKITILNRGDFGSENDMKPHRRSSSKLIRRTKNFGGKIKKIILQPRGI